MLNISQNDAIQKILDNIYNQNKLQNDEQIQISILKIVQYLYDNELAERKVEFLLFGSFVNGFATVDSDIDISINTNSFINETKALKHWITQVQYQNQYQIIQQLEYAKIPVLKLIDEVNNIKFDICYNNVLGCINSKLLFAYSELDKKVKQGGVLLKIWAKEAQILTNCLFSSYTITILWLHFLQEMFNLPNLQDKKYKPKDMQSEIMIRRIINQMEKDKIIQQDVTIKVDSFFIYNNEQYKKVKKDFQAQIKEIPLIFLLKQFFFYYSKQGKGFNQLYKISITNKELKPRSKRYSMCDPFDSYHDPLKKLNKFFKRENVFDNALNFFSTEVDIQFLFSKEKQIIKD